MLLSSPQLACASGKPFASEPTDPTDITPTNAAAAAAAAAADGCFLPAGLFAAPRPPAGADEGAVDVAEEEDFLEPPELGRFLWGATGALL